MKKRRAAKICCPSAHSKRALMLLDCGEAPCNNIKPDAVCKSKSVQHSGSKSGDPATAFG